MGLMWGEAQSTRGEGGVVLGEDLARGITGTDTNYRAWNWGKIGCSAWIIPIPCSTSAPEFAHMVWLLAK